MVLRISRYVVHKAEIEFLHALEWKTWVGCGEYEDFVRRFEIVWKLLFQGEDSNLHSAARITAG